MVFLTLVLPAVLIPVDGIGHKAGETAISDATLSGISTGKIRVNSTELAKAGSYKGSMVFECSYVD